MKTISKILLVFILALHSITIKAQNKMTSDTLNAHQKSMVAIASLTAVGNMNALKTEINTGLDVGLKVNEIKEALVQLYAYCGFPRSLNAINSLMTIVEERRIKGIKTDEGIAGIVTIETGDRYERGRLKLEELTKTTQKKPAPGFGEFAPRIDAFLKEHLFADIFDNEVLNTRQREFVTISALAAMPGVEGQLKAHIGMGKNTGITENQLVELATIIEDKISATQANTIRNILEKPLASIIETDMMIRISEIEIVPEYLEEYNRLLKLESTISVNEEKGVIAIFPMQQKEHPNQIRIIEIYANNAAYKSHLQTKQFKDYKELTLKMVKDLKLVDMTNIAPETMQAIFKKLK